MPNTCRIDQHDRLALAMQASLSASGRRKLRVCGQDEQFPNDSFMCVQDSHGCESGAHACSGLLGRFNGLTVAVIACRYDEVAYPGTATVPGRLLYHGEEEGYGPQHDGSAHAEELLGWCRAHQAHSLYYDQGEFATFFHKLTPATQALYLTVPSIYEWTLIRSLFLQSNHMTDAAGAVAHLATVRAQNPSDFRTLLHSADLRAARAPELYEAMAEAELTLHLQEMYTASILAELWEIEDDDMCDCLKGRPDIRTWLVLRYAYSLSGGFTYSDDFFAYLRQSFVLGDQDILEILLSSEAPKNTLSLDQYYVGLMWYDLLGNDDANLRATYQEAAENEPKVRDAVIADPDIYAKLVELGEIGAIPPGEESGYSPSDSDC
ncbi:hypothetical protein ACFY2H_42175 [Streptomyces griseofuscus]|uniref:hypothetical protein n=1 Tax=Streptomyces griseofuscus TaxID=146922 RepID=UPI0036C14B3A